jgi:hypothetical protein
MVMVAAVVVVMMMVALVMMMVIVGMVMVMVVMAVMMVIVVMHMVMVAVVMVMVAVAIVVMMMAGGGDGDGGSGSGGGGDGDGDGGDGDGDGDGDDGCNGDGYDGDGDDGDGGGSGDGDGGDGGGNGDGAYAFVDIREKYNDILVTTFSIPWIINFTNNMKLGKYILELEEYRESPSNVPIVSFAKLKQPSCTFLLCNKSDCKYFFKQMLHYTYQIRKKKNQIKATWFHEANVQKVRQRELPRLKAMGLTAMKQHNHINEISGLSHSLQVDVRKGGQRSTCGTITNFSEKYIRTFVFGLKSII